MRIKINGKEAVIKAGSSFEFISENRYFTGSDSYTLAIEFPIADCIQNKEIFGNINRKDIEIEKKQFLFDCEIFAGKFYKTGSITITEINDKTVKCQFLEGRSVQNYDNTLDNIYINDLAIGYWPDAFSDNSVAEELMRCESPTYTAIPWVNNTSGNIQNPIYLNIISGYNWHPDFVSSTEKRVSFCPYLIYIFKKIFDAIEYTYDIQTWNNSRYKWLLICNCVPATWGEYNWNYILPHWTITEFIEELEKFMNCQFDIDNIAKTIKMTFPSTEAASHNKVEIKVIKEATATKTDEDESEYEENMGKAYASVDSEKFTAMTSTIPRDTLEYQQSLGPGRHFYKGIMVDNYSDTLDGMIRRSIFKTVEKEYQERYASTACFYANREKFYYVEKGTECKYDYQDPDNPNVKIADIDSAQFYAERIGEFAPIKPKEGSKSVELKIVPAIIDETDYDFAVFLECGEKEDPNAIYDDFHGQTSKAEIYIRKYEKEAQKEVFDKLFVAFWNAEILDEFKIIRTLKKDKWVNQGSSGQGPQYWEYEEQDVGKICIPHPIVSNYEPVWAESCRQPTYFNFSGYSLALEASNFVNKKIEGRVKHTFKWIADDIPDVGSLFIISGQAFLCKKITATFSEKGMSQLLKGEFYRVVETES